MSVAHQNRSSMRLLATRSSIGAGPIASACHAISQHRIHVAAFAVPSRNRATVRLLNVRASWGAPVEFSSAKLIKAAAAGPGLRKLFLDIGRLAEGYTVPGQYIQVKVGDSKPGFFAIASAPDYNNQGVVELLIKSQPSSTAELLAAASEGSEVLVSPVQGKGFPIANIPPSEASTVLLFATGTGISPIKALIESDGLAARGRKDVRLFYGTKNPGATAYSELLPLWQASGVKVIQVFSEDGNGYVQDTFAAKPDISDSASAGIVLCGHKAMCEAIKATATAAGVPAEKILLNF